MCYVSLELRKGNNSQCSDLILLQDGLNRSRRPRSKTKNCLNGTIFKRESYHLGKYSRNQIGLPSAFLIGQEINPDSSTQDACFPTSAYDADTSSLIVIELKRDSNKLQLLQALSYAAMISRWDSKTLISNIQRNLNPEYEELVEIITSTTLNADVRVVLVAGRVRP